MSFIDLATLTMHRRSEMEDRINILAKKCDQAQANIRNLNVQAQGFVDQLNCDPKDLKERFLNCMKQLDEYIYLMTDINLSFANIETESIESQPVQDTPCKALPILQPHLLDVLSELPSTSTPIPASCQVKEKIKKKKKSKHLTKPEVLIQFSSTSSQESVPDYQTQKVEKEVQCGSPVEELEHLQLNESICSEKGNLPQQAELQLNVPHEACVMHVDGGSLWLVAGAHEIDQLHRLMLDMKQYYSAEDAAPAELGATYYAYRDEDGDAYYRCMFLKLAEEHADIAQVFLVDTGELRFAQLDALRPLAPAYTRRPPYARLCHLAAIDIIEGENEKSQARHEKFLKQFIGSCTVIVDDNASESLGVILYVDNNEQVNRLMVIEGLAVPAGGASSSVVAPLPAALPPRGPPELYLSVSELDITDCPEHEDPVEAVTGYHNRDEIDICKHYKGGPERKCFKGSRCKKRHVVKHPGGWTLDRVPARSAWSLRAAPAPPPGAAARALVTCVEHFDAVWLQFVTDPDEQPKHSLGEAFPLMTLEALEDHMNKAAARDLHKPFKLAPHPGAAAAALYPPDGRWYRAAVLAPDHDHLLEVQYLDYGNKMSIHESNVRQLAPEYWQLPRQAARCRLAGVRARSSEAQQWAAAKQALDQLALNKTLTALIIESDYDSLVVELQDGAGASLGARLAALGLVTLDRHCARDRGAARRVVVP